MVRCGITIGYEFVQLLKQIIDLIICLVKFAFIGAAILLLTLYFLVMSLIVFVVLVVIIETQVKRVVQKIVGLDLVFNKSSSLISRLFLFELFCIGTDAFNFYCVYGSCSSQL